MPNGFVRSGHVALELLEQQPAQVVVSDMRMPHMDGIELLKQIKERWPEIIRIALSAHASSPQLLAAINAGEVYRYLTKPLQPADEIKAELRNAIEVYELRRVRRNMRTRLETRNRELEEALAKVKTLEGLLPICAWCKKVRNDTGYWEQIERYISAHSNAAFTHGVCPECEKKLNETL